WTATSSHLPTGRFGNNLVHAVQVDHATQLGLVDDHIERLLKRGEDLDRPERVSPVVFLEVTDVGDFLGLQLKNVADDLLDVFLALRNKTTHEKLLARNWNFDSVATLRNADRRQQTNVRYMPDPAITKAVGPQNLHNAATSDVFSERV